jgi:5-methyltetrahydrofolate--homocysteine methyltransferase
MSEVLPGVPLIAKPNAGLPRVVDGQTLYDTPPEVFAERIEGFTRLGARIVGACCGSNPQYIRAIRSKLNY